MVLLWEKLWPLLVPAFMVFCAFLVFSWAGGWIALGGEGSKPLLWIFRVLFVTGFVACLLPLRKLVLPGETEITRRIELKSKLDDRPMTAQSDPIAMGDKDAFSTILWQEHRTRMAGRLNNMTSGAPAPQANRFDPFAIRAILPILAFAAFFYSFSPFGGRVADFYEERQNSTVLLTRMDAWVNPPAYTRKPPVYLSLDKAGTAETTLRSLTVPEGSEFFLRFVGRGDIQILRSTEGDDISVPPVENTDNAEETEFTFALEEDSVVRLYHRGNELAQWGITLIPDKKPKITFSEHPTAALSGSLELAFTVKDDYGVVKAEAEIKSLEETELGARPLVKPPVVDLPLPSFRAKEGLSKVNRDLTQHPWAGSRVSIQLKATDDAGLTGVTETREITLPGRRFSNPLALALVEQRRVLALDARKQLYVANLLDAVSTAPPEFIDNTGAVLGMRVAYRRIIDARNDDQLRDTLDLLWDIALGVEFGDLSEAEKRLREAQEQLSEALENNASQEEIDRLMKELREAMNQMLQALAEQARQNPQEQNPFNPNDQTQTLTQNDLERMMDRIEDLAKSGSEDAARQLLSEMQRMMDNLRSGRHEQQRQAEGNELNQALDQLSELMQRQQELMNETYRMQRQQQEGLRENEQSQNQQGQQQQQNQQQQGQQRQGQQQQGEQQGGQRGEQSQQGQQGQMTEQEFADALKRLQEQQEALEQQLGQLGKQLEELGLGQSEELGNAEREMGEAGGNLAQGETGSAATDQGQALEALRQGAQSMMQQMAGDRQQGGQQQSQRGGQGQSEGQRSSDPLGRRNDGNTLTGDTDTRIPGEIDAQRARRIQEAIRKRLSDALNPLIEKDYLERLLRSE